MDTRTGEIREYTSAELRARQRDIERGLLVELTEAEVKLCTHLPVPERIEVALEKLTRNQRKARRRAMRAQKRGAA